MEASESSDTRSFFTNYMNKWNAHDQEEEEFDEYMKGIKIPLVLDYEYNKQNYHHKCVEIVDKIESEQSSLLDSKLKAIRANRLTPS
mmetsp:Transcript_10779/g.16395  ORF Transcript_10779/g.16395 Transcript_10779/m.16395 type:complete len:87 (-) Transcript_10779:200-460(-)